MSDKHTLQTLRNYRHNYDNLAAAIELSGSNSRIVLSSDEFHEVLATLSQNNITIHAEYRR